MHDTSMHEQRWALPQMRNLIAEYNLEIIEENDLENSKECTWTPLLLSRDHIFRRK